MARLPTRSDFGSPLVAAQIRRAIAEGEAKQGERLPPARDQAAVMGVNTKTVLRALRLLGDEGLLESAAGWARPQLTWSRHPGYAGAL
jgi:DNA-binding transcriptional MocR family regulator